MAETKIFAQGVWCMPCETFEEDPQDVVIGRCMACGCSIANHVKAQVTALPEADDNREGTDG